MGPNDLLGELMTSLQDEGEALVADDAERLSAASARKAALLTRLSPQLRQVGHGDSPLDLAKLRQANLMNGMNAQLLAVRMRANGARLEVLTRSSDDSTYGARGAVAVSAQAARARSTA
jgi:hypothetical protein